MVRDVAGGEYRMPRDVRRRVFRRLRHLPEEIDSPRRKALTEREKEILTQFAKGMSYFLACLRPPQPFRRSRLPSRALPAIPRPLADVGPVERPLPFLNTLG